MRAELRPASRKGRTRSPCGILRLTRAAKQGSEGRGADGTDAIGMRDSDPSLPFGRSGLRRGPPPRVIPELVAVLEPASRQVDSLAPSRAPKRNVCQS
jgi:hypothetical protein